MIAVDTSALLAIVLGEPLADACAAALDAENKVLISAGTVAEALIVSGRRGVAPGVERLIQGLEFEIVPVSPASARRVAIAYERWGKGVHKARLNLGDCFAYEVANSHDCPLLFIGTDFAQTDIKRVL